jgi:acetoacetate decarboxylase
VKKFPVTRREFFGFAAAGAAFATIGDVSAETLPPLSVRGSYFGPMRDRLQAAGAKPDKFGNLRGLVACRYRTDPERIARVLPPHLEPDDDPVVLLDWFMILSHPEAFIAFVPGWTYGEADLFVSCKFEGHSCMLPLALILEQDFGRYAGREGQSLRKKEGQVNIDVTGRTVRAWTSRKGELVSAIETEFTDEPSHPLYWMREVGWGWMRADYRLHPDWRQGPIEEDEVAIWRHFGYDAGYPTGMPEERFLERVPRACDVSKTRIVLGDDPLTPFGEFPVREILGVSFGTGGGEGADTREPMAVPRGPDKEMVPTRSNSGRHQVGSVPAEEYARWAFVGKGYDRPVSNNRVWIPEGWPEKASAVTLTDGEVERWRSRSSLDLDPADIADIQLAIDPAKHAATLPPPCRPGDEPIIRILAIRAEASDLTTRPFTELWLLSRCLLEGAPGWYALSHIISWDGDMLFGRETYGYPTKVGEPQMTVDPLQVSLLGRRFMRDFFHATIALPLDDPQPHEADLTVIGLRPSPKDVEPKVRYVTQPWRIEIADSRRARPEEVHLAFPTDPGPANIGTNEPWFDFADGTVVSAATGRGVVRRLPGAVSPASVADLDLSWFRERMDGMTGRAPQSGTYLVGTTTTDDASAS